MIELNLARIESMHSTSDDRVERGMNQLDFHKIESMHFTSDDRVKRGTNRIDFADLRVDIIAICRRKDSIFESTILKQTAHHTPGSVTGRANSLSEWCLRLGLGLMVSQVLLSLHGYYSKL